VHECVIVRVLTGEPLGRGFLQLGRIRPGPIEPRPEGFRLLAGEGFEFRLDLRRRRGVACEGGVDVDVLT